MPTSEQIEKAARAICREKDCDPDNRILSSGFCGYQWQEFSSLARAALEAVEAPVKVKERLPYVVQYRRKDCAIWADMAAFDVMGVAERYRDKCASGNPPWEYQVIEARILSALTEAGE